MELSASLSQQQFLSPQMQQGLQLLQAPMMELRQLVSVELTANPVLEEEFSSSLEDSLASEEKNSIETSVDESPWNEDLQQISASLSTGQEEERHRYLLESRPSRMTLADVMHAQSAAFPEKDKMIVDAIIGNLDEWGYFRMSAVELAETLPLSEKTDEQGIEEVLKKIQQLDPPGIAARDLTECLLLQLERQGKENSLASRIVRHYLSQLARHHYEEIAKSLRVSLPEVMQALKLIASLEPHPARPYVAVEEQAVIPDVIVIAEGEEFLVRLNEEGLPRVRISDYYKEILAAQADHKEVRDYLREKIRSGKTFIHYLEQRQATLLLVTREIVRRQKDFFNYGTYGMHSLTMAEIADSVGLHVTTIGRAVAGKTMDTPQGLFSLKYFFTPGFAQEDGKNISNEMVKSSLRQLIHEENKQAPLSDQAIVTRLKAQGVSVARRTIASYREQLGILPANLRKMS